MNQRDEQFLEALYRDRADSAKTLEKPSMRGIKHSVVEKYSDQAHFIYELLQNADDAHATNARFILEPTRLIFAHNGTRLFSVSDPQNEDDDSEAGCLGDINAITSIANSNKTEASIGKFGVGFKAVFQYTSTPHIYDPNFRFKIERFIVPVRLTCDFPGRCANETLFVFPFDHPLRRPEESYQAIADKLKSLSFPLLFLSELQSIEFEFDNAIGQYEKTVKRKYTLENITAEQICLTQNNGVGLSEDNLWLFSALNDQGHRYSIGFFLDERGSLKPVNQPAFCFFPTKEVTGLNFILHAPFLLTDSREGIRAGVHHNDKMLRLLSKLAASSLVLLIRIGELESQRLIDDRILDIIPYDSNRFSDPNDKQKVSFLPFYTAIRETFEKEEILPSVEGYVSAKNAYWASVPQLAQLFSNEQLREICDNDSAQWAFPSISRDDTQSANRPLFGYLNTLLRTSLTDNVILSGRSNSFYNRFAGSFQDIEPIKGITAEFIERQPIPWLHRFYHWIADSKNRTKTILKRPVFLNQQHKATPAYDKAGQLILFLPVEDAIGYSVVHPALLDDAGTMSLIQEIGIKPPSLRDQIYNIILPQYEKGKAIKTDPHFKLFFEYYCDHCMNGEDEEFIDLIKSYEFLTCFKGKNSHPDQGAASTMYLPSPQLVDYFETKPDVNFIEIEKYHRLAGPSKEKQLISFLTELGIRREIGIERVTIDYFSSNRKDLPNPYSTGGKQWTEGRIIGCKEILNHIIRTRNSKKSLLLWNSLLSLIASRSRYESLSQLLKGYCDYFYYRSKREDFVSSDEVDLQQMAWLVNRDGEFVSAANIDRKSLWEEYDISSPEAVDLMDFLSIADQEETEENFEEDDSYLTDTQREKIELANKYLALGFDESDLKELKRIKEQREARAQSNQPSAPKGTPNEPDESAQEEDTDEILSHRKLNKTTSKVMRDIAGRTNDEPSPLSFNAITPEEEIDQDELIPSPVDYSKRIERAKEKSAAEIDRIVFFETLQNCALNQPKYTFGWFKALLEMECLNSSEANSRSREVCISFARVEREPETKRTLILKQPNRYIPQFMEDLADIPLVLHMEETKKTVAIEVVSIKSYTLHVKLKNETDIHDVDLSKVKTATIDAKSPAFLLEELKKQFVAMAYADDFNMRDNLCENIEFIFGPPGTGKTTHLAKNVLIPMMRRQEPCRVLVLTPTNKAADVLVRRMMEALGDNHSYENWLIRFGATGDEVIEQSPVFKDKTFDIRTLSKNVTVTTIARFPYDFFMPQGNRIFLKGFHWDYIVIDEASMIPLVNIIYPLYEKTPRRFIIAGDPFQIEPITSVDLWKNENIYTLVGLDSFVTPKTVPYAYRVELLMTQYRSIPEIGNVFSRFAYGGLLKHHRSSESRRPLRLGSSLSVSPMNIVKFPVSRYESIYRAKRLQHSSSYQIYSALFTYEYLCHLSRLIGGTNPGERFNIGVIAPYRAQADLIEKLVSAEKLPDGIDVQVGTIHGFQGDECDIIFAVFNPPPTISDSSEMFLNKRNIINVSISRARDYLFVIMPDDHTESIENLRLVKRVELLIKNSGTCTESLSSDLEKLIFGDPNYLENNSFSTSHQSVNVYGLPEKRYEVRTEESAVDIQIHRGTQLSTENVVLPVSEVTTPNDTFSNLIPKDLRKGAISFHVKGEPFVEYQLIPYNGKLKKYTNKKGVSMYISLIIADHERLVPITVIKEDRIIYISSNFFRHHEIELSRDIDFELKINSMQ